MKNLSFAALFTVLAGVCATALVVTFLMVRDDVAEARAHETGAQPLAGAGPGAEQLEELERRLEALVFENRALTQRVEELEARPAPSPRSPVGGFVTREEFEALVSELRGTDDTDPAPEPIDELFESRVATALGEIRKQERVDAVETYQAARVERIDADVAKLGEWLELDAVQERGMRTALLAQYDRESELTRLWKAGETDDEELGRIKRADREEFRADLAEILSVEQLDTFWTGVVEKGK